MGCLSPLQPRLLSSFFGDRLLLHSPKPILGCKQGNTYEAVQLSKTFCSLVDSLFNKRSQDEMLKNKLKRLRPGKVSPRLLVPDHIPKPPYVNSRQSPGIASGPEIHDSRGVECMRATGKLAAQVLEYAGTFVKPGTTTDEIDKAVHQMIIDNGAYPSPLGYGGFPKSVCTSVNECICHGIPDSRELEDGDIINIDVTVYLNGYHGDTSATFLCGSVDEEAKTLVQVTEECLYKAISICAPGVEFNRIGKTIQNHADKFRFGVVRQFVGHGVGRVFHSDPVILHYRNNEHGRMVLGQTFTIDFREAGLRLDNRPTYDHLDDDKYDKVLYRPFTIYFMGLGYDGVYHHRFRVSKSLVSKYKLLREPMLTTGSTNPVIWSDNWTAVTEDGSLSAQFEHTILITENGAEILTRC